jgi:hypothetical protein
MLQNLNALMGASVLASDGEFGSVRDFLFDDRSWLIRYVMVEVGSWFKRREVVLPVAALESLNWKARKFNVRLTREQLCDSPDIGTEKSVSRQQEIAMEEYFGKMAFWLYANMAGEPRFRPGRNTQSVPIKTRIYAAFGTWLITKCGLPMER